MKHANPKQLCHLVPALPVLAVALALASCLAPRRVEPFYDAMHSYNEAVRWQRYDDAAARVPADRREDFLDVRDELAEDLRVSGYDVVRVRYDNTGRRAKVQLKYTWHLDSRGVVHTTHVVQRWERPQKTWVLLEEHHLRGEPMPGVEPAPWPRALPEADRTDEALEEPEEPEEVEESGSSSRNPRKRTESAAHTRRDPSR